MAMLVSNVHGSAKADTTVSAEIGGSLPLYRQPKIKSNRNESVNFPEKLIIH